MAFRKQQQSARHLKVERAPARGQRANHDRAGKAQALFGGPERVLALLRRNHDEPRQIDPERRQARRIRRAGLREHALFARPNHTRRSRPLRRKRERKAKCGRIVPRRGWAELVQRLDGHGGEQSRTRLISSPVCGGAFPWEGGNRD